MNLIQSFIVNENKEGIKKVNLSLFASGSYFVTIKGFADFTLQEKCFSASTSDKNYQEALKLIFKLGIKYGYKNTLCKYE